ncbi:MAG: hypothetical protein ACOCYP_09240 [Planctomycetota bacterium]
MSPSRVLLALIIATGAAPALESELFLGPEEVVAGVEILSQHIEDGAIRLDDVSTRLYGRGRYANVGVQLQTWIAIGDDDARRIDSGEFTEISGRIDYLYETDTFQLLPHYIVNGYPAYENVDEAHWLGADFWYLLPWEGVEIGTSFDYDIGDEYGWFASIGARQFLQNAPVDFRSWQILNFGDTDYHQRYTSGADNDGLTTFELGGEVIVPMPWINGWITGKVEGHWWLDSKDKDRLEDSAEMVIGFGGQFRL